MTLNLSQALSKHRAAFAKGPIALVMAEDDIEVASTVRHLRKAGFRLVVVFGSEKVLALGLPDDGVLAVAETLNNDGAVPALVNQVIAAAPGVWIHYCFNGEYLFHPFCETRDVVEMLTFHGEERRDAMLTTVVDLYPQDLAKAPNGVDTQNAMLDGAGYYALRRYRGRDPEPMDRQLDIFGGLRWRYENHVPERSRRIDRISLFRAKPGLELRDDHTLNDEEMNTYSCPWHHNMTSAIASFRAAKALLHNPGSRRTVGDLKWKGSVHFNWTSQQLMDLGFMEPGQWF